MIVPLMIWSARTVMDSQAWIAETAIPVSRAASEPDEQRRRGAEGEVGLGLVREDLHDQRGREPADEGGREHHALDADVDDAGALVHEAAQAPRAMGAASGQDDRRQSMAGRR